MSLRHVHRYAFSAFGGPLQERIDELPEPVGSEITVRVSHCGMCHSDLHFHAGGFDLGDGQMSSLTKAGATLPITLGHEIAGEVLDVGPEVRDLRPGQAVVVYPWLGCGECPTCQRGDEHLCGRAMRNLGLQLPGGYADLVRVPHERYAVPIGTLEPARAATLACSGITALGAIRQLGELGAQHTVAVIGCGGVGLMAVALLTALSKARVIAIDPDAAKREAALQCRAAQAHDPSAPEAGRAIARANPQGIDAVLDFVGSEASTAMAQSLVRRAGQIVVVGLYGGQWRIPIPLLPLRSLRISGSYVGGLQDLRELVALAQRMSLPAVPLQLRPLAQANEALADLAAGRVVGRTVLTP